MEEILLIIGFMGVLVVVFLFGTLSFFKDEDENNNK